MIIERRTEKTFMGGLEHNEYEIWIDGDFVTSFNELSDDFALVNANEFIENRVALEKTRGVLPTVYYK